MDKKITLVIAVFVLASIGLTGCSNSDDDDSSNGGDDSSDGGNNSSNGSDDSSDGGNSSSSGDDDSSDGGNSSSSGDDDSSDGGNSSSSGDDDSSDGGNSSSSGDDDSSDGGNSSSSGDDDSSHGISQSTKMSSLNQQEIDQICASIESRMLHSTEGFSSLIDSNDFSCSLQAFAMTKALGGTEEDCENSKEECLQGSEWEAEGSGEDQSISEEIDCGTPEDLVDCEATVGDIDTCFDALLSEIDKVVEQVEAVMEEMSCSNVENDNVTIPDIEANVPDTEDIPACLAAEEKCPGLV